MEKLNGLINDIENNRIERVKDTLKKNPGLANPILNCSEMDVKVTPFWTAVLAGHIEMIEILKEFGADVNESIVVHGNENFEKRLTVLQYLAYYSDDPKKQLNTAKKLIDLGAGVDYFTVSIQKTPLQIAVQENNVEYVKFLLLNGAKLEGQTWDSMSIMKNLFHSKTVDLYEMVTTLINYGKLEISKVDLQGKNYLHCSIELAKYKPEVGLNIVKIADTLIDCGVPVDGTDCENHTALIKAISSQNIELISLLIVKGANVNLKSGNSGLFPLHYAVLIQSESICDLLLNSGAIFDMTTNNGSSLIFTALHLKSKKMISYLVSKGSNLDLKYQGIFILYDAVCNNYHDLIQEIIHLGADINAQTELGDSSLHCACYLGYEKIVEILVSKGANISLQNNRGITPLHYLVENKNKEGNKACITIMLTEMAKSPKNLLSEDLHLILSDPVLKVEFESLIKK